MSIALICVLVVLVLAVGIKAWRKARTGSFLWWSHGKGGRDG
jgi:hypothetical protein